LNFIPNSKKGLILLHRGGSSVRVVSEQVDVMLSPSLYTLKRESLEIKFAHQAKKLAPSVLDELIDEKEYQYSAFKDEQGWVFIAYSPSQVLEALKQTGLDPAQVGKLYFAQQSSTMFSNPIALDAQHALGLVDGIVTVMPKALYGERRFLSFDESFRPNSGGVSLGINSQDSIIEKKDAIILASIFVVVGTLFVFEGLGYASASSKQNSTIDTLLEDHPSLQSKYSRDSIAAKYQKRDKQERKKREFFKELGSIVRYGGVVTEISIDAKSMKAKMHVSNKNSYNSVDRSINIKAIDANNIELEANL
jgi:hypothetical protein